MMECGQVVEVVDVSGAYAVRFIAQCGGRWLVVSNMAFQQTAHNGLMLEDWRGVMRELVALAVPRSLELDKARDARSIAGGSAHHVRLSYPLSVKALAGLIGEDAEEVRALLHDLAVQAE